ncbi:MAG: hypothetical protein HFE90_08285 [Firmicutes bacterium]|nr:hypothetical protein [Bacillota bacterium]
MKVKALMNFTGAVCGYPGEILDIPDNSAVLHDLLKVGYVEKLEDSEEKPQKKKTVTKK